MKPSAQTIAPGDPIDAAILQVELLYRSLTGHHAPSPGDMPFAPIPPEKEPERHVAEQIDQLLKDLDHLSSRLSVPVWVPALSVFEGPEDVRICLDVPGVQKDSIELRLLDATTLEVSGERPVRTEQDGNVYRLRHAENVRGRFRRVIALAAPAKPDQLNAKLQDGELEIRLPRARPEVAEAQKIRVE